MNIKKTYIRKTICPYDCPTSCGFLVTTDGEQLLSVQGDPEHPVTKGIICHKMKHYERSVHNPKRILTPLRRTGEKGEGKFEPISWDEAVREITDKWKEILSQDGGDAILPMYYSGVMSEIQRKCGDAFWNRMGACEVERTLCSSAKGAGYASVMGKTGCLDPRELENSDLILIWGCDVKATRIHTLKTLTEARRAGKKVILIEVCAYDMADYCDEVIYLRPGTDGALALGMMHVLIRDGLADEEFLREKADGYEELKEVVKLYTPEMVEELTDVPACKIEELAHTFGSVKAPAILLGSGPSRYGNGGMTTRLITILSAITGAWGRPGGGFCGCNPGIGSYIDSTLVTRPDFRKRSSRCININQLGAALTDTEAGKMIKSLYVYGSNPAASVSDQAAILRGLKRDDLFTVVHERFMTETARYADIILPATFSVEQSDCYGAYGYCTYGTAYKVLEPAGESKSNWNTFQLLANAMGYEEAYFQRTEEEMVEELLSHPGPGLAYASEDEWEILRRGGVISTPFSDHGEFKTATGKVMIMNPGEDILFPCYQVNHVENLKDMGTLHLVSVPALDTLNSIFEERDDLKGKRGPAKLLLHPQDAAQRGIRNGDRILAWNELAEVEFTAVLTELVKPGTAAAPGIYNAQDSGQKYSVNALHHGRISDMGAATTMNDNRIEVRRVANVG
ncbi:MAG: molybdopterin-dependent oxidoreductase [Brotaphodocola sp.]